MRRCLRCGREVIACPTLCTFDGWKHLDTGLHRCELPARKLAGKHTYRPLLKYAIH